ncbi:MAG: hypothetical protein EOM28_10215 [Clostridia bacterium]|nr:hypothetical protein [Clostridia bacterium]
MKKEKGADGLNLFSFGSELEEIPAVLPVFLGFLLAMFLLNLGISFFRKKAARDNKKEADATEEKQEKR